MRLLFLFVGFFSGLLDALDLDLDLDLFVHLVISSFLP